MRANGPTLVPGRWPRSSPSRNDCDWQASRHSPPGSNAVADLVQRVAHPDKEFPIRPSRFRPLGGSAPGPCSRPETGAAPRRRLARIAGEDHEGGARLNMGGAGPHRASTTVVITCACAWLDAANTGTWQDRQRMTDESFLHTFSPSLARLTGKAAKAGGVYLIRRDEACDRGNICRYNRRTVGRDDLQGARDASARGTGSRPTTLLVEADARSTLWSGRTSPFSPTWRTPPVIST